MNISGGRTQLSTVVVAVLAMIGFLAGSVVAETRFSEPVQLTTDPGEDFAPTVSRDGSFMVYVSDRSGNLDLWLKTLKPGPSLPDRQLTFHGAADSSPSLSTDGRWVAFISHRSDAKGDLYLLQLDEKAVGREPKIIRLTDASSSESDPAWAPDGKFVFFSSLTAESNFKKNYRINVTGGPKVLVSAIEGFNGAVSPDGRHLVFVSRKDDPTGSIWVQDLKSNALVQATRGEDIDVAPNWSEDGKRIYFVRYRDDTNGDGRLTIEDRSNIWGLEFVGAAPGKLQQLTDSSTYDLFPNEVKGKLIFTSDRKSNIDVWELPAQGLLALPGDYAGALKIVDDLCPGLGVVSHQCLLAYTNLTEKFSDGGNIAHVHYRLAKGYWAMGNASLAEKVFNVILEEYSGDPVYKGLAEIDLLLLQTAKSKQEGESAYRKKIREALKSLTAMTSHSDRRVAARALLEMGNLNFELEKLNRALNFYKKVITEYPRQRSLAAEAAWSQSKIFTTVGDFDKLTQAFVQVVQDYYDVKFWRQKAIQEIFALFEKQPTLREKVSELHALSIRYKKTPLLAAALQNRIGELYYLDDENLLAKEVYKKNVKQFPDVVFEKFKAQFALANIYSEEENFEKSLLYYQEVVAATQGSKELQANWDKARKGYIRKSIEKGKWELKVGETQLALKSFLKLIEFSSETIEAHRGYVQAGAALGNIASVIEFYKNRLQKKADSAADHYALGLAHTYLNPPGLDDAENEVGQALRVNSQDVYFHQTLGWVFEQKETLQKKEGYLERALHEYQTALALNNETLDPENEANLLLNLGNGNYLLKNFSTAYHYYKGRSRTGLEFANPIRAAVFYQRFGESAFKAGNSEGAVEYFGKALEIVSEKKEPERMAELNDRIALAWQDLRKYAKAVKHFTAALELNRETGNHKSMTRAIRNIANNLFWLSQEKDHDDTKSMSLALNQYFQAVENLEKFGAIGKEKKSQDGLVNIQVETPLGENASTAATGFDEVGEKKMMFHYIGKIYGDFKEYEKAVEYFQKKLSLIPENLDPKKDIAAFLEKALIQNQIGNFYYRKGDNGSSLRYFRLSYEVSRQLENRYGMVVNAANIGRVLLAKLQSQPIGALRGEIKSTVKLLEDTVRRMEKFKNFTSPEYGVYIRNYIGIFYQYLAWLSQNPSRTLVNREKEPSAKVFLAAYKELQKESEFYVRAFESFGKKSTQFFEQALAVAGNLDPGPEKGKLQAVLQQNLLLANQSAWKPGRDKKVESPLQIENELLPYRWQFKFLQSLEEDGQKRLDLLLQAEEMLSHLPYTLLPTDSSSRTMLSELYRVLTGLLFDREEYRMAMYFSDKGLLWNLIALRQDPSLKTRNFQDETRQSYYEELESIATQVKEAVDGTAKGERKLDAERLQMLLDEYAEFLSLMREDDRELASLFYPDVPDIREVQALLRPGDLILKYQEVNDRILIWAIDRSSVRGGTFICDPRILKLIFRVAGNAGNVGLEEIAGLSNTFIVPVKGLLEKARFLYLIADGPLEFLPWAAMNFNRRALVETLPISFLSSLSHYHFSQAKKNLYNSRLLAVDFPEQPFNSLEQHFSATRNLAGDEGTSDRFQAHWRHYGVLNIESPTVLRSTIPGDSYISMTRKENHFERRGLPDFFRTTLGANFIALNNLQLEINGTLSPTALLLQGLTFTGYPGALLGVRSPPHREEFLELFYSDFRKGNPAESLRRAQIELARRHPGSHGWAEYRFYGFPGMTDDEKETFAQTHFDANVKNGLQAFSEKRWESSINSFEKALSLIDFLPEKKFQMEIYKTLALGAYNLEDYPAAIRYQSELARLAEQTDDPEQLAEATYFLGILHSRAENFPRAVELLQKALSIYQEYELLDRLAESYSTLGIVQENALDYGEALQAFSASLRINEEIGEDLSKGKELRRMGRIYYLRLSNYNEAKKYFTEANALFNDLGQTDQIVETLLELGLVSEKQGDFDQALALYREAQILTEENGLQLGLSKSLLYQGNSYWYQGNYQNAFRMQKRSLKIAETIGSKRQETFIRNTLGLIYWTLNDSERALRELERSRGLAEEINSLLDIATAFNNIGLVYRKDKKYEKSIEFFNKALERDIQLKSKWGQGYTHRNLGMSYLRMGRLEQAETHIKQAIDLSRGIGNKTNEVKSMLERGNLALKRKQCHEAIAVFRETAALASALGIPEVHWRALRGQGVCLAQTGNRDDAIAAYKKAVGVVEKMRAAIKIEEFQNGFLTDKQDVYKELILLLLDQGKVEESFIFAERGKSRSFIDLLGNNKVDLKNEVSQKIYDRLILQKLGIRKLEEALGQSEDEEKTRQLSADLIAERNRYEDILIEAKEQSPQISSFITVESISLGQVQELLEKDVVLVEYLVTKNELVAWVVKKDSLAVIRVPVSEKDLTRVVKDYRKRMQELAPLEEQSAQLYAWLIEPIEKHIRGTRILGLIPNGILHYVSFASLKGEEGYLVERHPLFYSPSASVLEYTFARKFKKGEVVKVLAIGNPDLGDLNYDLPLAELEAKSIKWDFPQIDLLTGDRAKEKWVKEHIADYQIIHIASHGEFDAVNPLFSALKLTRDESEDGNLEVNEVFSLNINADLVTLSACQTGLGKITGGDELVGLNRAFIYAGTHAILSSLWRVSDISTAILIKHFYRTYAHGEKAESLRKAQLLVKKNYPHPSYWSGFNLTGDYR